MESEFVDSDENRKNIVEESGDTIVSASAGSGKTTVMIRRMVEKIVKSAERDVAGKNDDRVGLDNILAVTFTNKAAANMKDRLRARLGDAIVKIEKDEKYKDWSSADKQVLRDKLIDQYNLIPAADISTVHSFCFNLIKKYFYLAGCGSDPEMLGDDNFEDAALRERAFDNLFNGREGKGGYYEKDDETEELKNEHFKILSECLRSNRRDDNIKETMMSAYGKVRSVANYREKLDDMSNPKSDYYTEKSFNEICGEMVKYDNEKVDELVRYVDEYKYRYNYNQGKNNGFDLVYEEYSALFDKVCEFLERQKNIDPRVENISKPQKGYGVCSYDSHSGIPGKLKLSDLSNDKQQRLKRNPEKKERFDTIGKDYTKFRKKLTDKYKNYFGVRKGYDEELDNFRNAGELAHAFARCLLDFDDEYSRVKREENKLDYNDLEQMAIDLLSNHEDVRAEVNGKYKLVFVDEFQDINPAQNRILSYLTGEKFYVGDVKQAIYAFRGSDSQCFIDAVNVFRDDVDKHVDHLTINFRSESDIINRVNEVFEVSMTKDVCDIEYKNDGNIMTVSENADKSDETDEQQGGRTQVHVFGRGVNDEDEDGDADEDEDEDDDADEDEDEKEIKPTAAQIYSMRGSAMKARQDDGEKAVAELVKRYKRGGVYKEGEICILARSNKMVRAVTKKLEEEGISIAGSEGGNILDSPEIWQILDILSYIDDGEQDLPMVSAMLSPIGDFTEDELASIRLASSGRTFRDRVENYKNRRAVDESRPIDPNIVAKINTFEERVENLKSASAVLSAGDLIDKIVRDTGIELRYSKHPEKSKAISMLAAKGKDKGLSKFLKEVKAKDAEIDLQASAASDGVNVMTMHAAKGLEFPVVIICDASKKFGTDDEYTCHFDEKRGFVFKAYDRKKLKTEKTILWLLKNEKDGEEDLKQELNLFYVACTRAQKRLDIVTKYRPKEYDIFNAKKHKSFRDIVDLNGFVDGDDPDMMDLKDGAEEKSTDEAGREPEGAEDKTKNEEPSNGHSAGDTAISAVVQDEEESCGEDFEDEFKKALDAKYKFEYMNAPAKTSVTAAIRKEEKYKKFLDADAEADEKPDDDDEDEEGGAKRADGADKMEVGTAYHKFLELWDDPEVRDAPGIGKMIDGFVESGQMTERQRDILRDDFHKDYSGPAAVAEVIYNKVYNGRTVEKAYHERRFLCNLPVEHVYEDKYRGEGAAAGSEDMVLVQGTIDLLVRYDGGKWHIFDYKYSEESEKKLHETYHRQLELYAEAAKKILGLNEEAAIETELVNINPRI